VERLKLAIVLLIVAVAGSACASAAENRSESSPSTFPFERSLSTHGIAIADLSWVSPKRGWALGSRTPCHSGCTEVLMTKDGGTSWSVVGHISASVPSVNPCIANCAAVISAPSVSEIMFANQRDGYAFGPGFFVTTDGGRRWQRPRSPDVAAMGVADGIALRLIFEHSGCPGPCDPTIEEVADNSGAWKPVGAPIPAITDRMQVVSQGHDMYVAFYANPAGGAQDQQTTILVSHDGGATWSSTPDPCGFVGTLEIDTTAIAAGTDGMVAVLCVPRQPGARPDSVKVSSDGGQTFGPASALPLGAYNQLALTSSRDLLVGIAPVAGIGGRGTVDYVLSCSDDAGTSWRTCARVQQSSPYQASPEGFLAFVSPLVARWVGYPYQLWGTNDGRHWRVIHSFISS
jgi:hypothetical protein